MPREKKIERYPESYFKLVERAYKHSVRIDCATARDAINLRAELYVFRTVLMAHPSVNPRAAYCATHVRFRVRGTALVAEPKPSSFIAPALRADQEKKLNERVEKMKSEPKGYVI